MGNTLFYHIISAVADHLYHMDALLIETTINTRLILKSPDETPCCVPPVHQVHCHCHSPTWSTCYTLILKQNVFNFDNHFISLI